MFHFFLSSIVFQSACEDSTKVESTSVNTEVEVLPLQKSSANENFDPLQGKSLQEICSANGLLLIKWPYSKVQNEFRVLCCSEEGLSTEDHQCQTDWPFSDVPGCEAYDEMRNEIFARYGRSFKTQKWQQLFAATDWYQIRSGFSDDWLSDVANENVVYLLNLKKDKVACMD